MAIDLSGRLHLVIPGNTKGLGLGFRGISWGSYRDNGKEKGNYRGYMGLYRDYKHYSLPACSHVQSCFVFFLGPFPPRIASMVFYIKGSRIAGRSSRKKYGCSCIQSLLMISTKVP